MEELEEAERNKEKEGCGGALAQFSKGKSLAASINCGSENLRYS